MKYVLTTDYPERLRDFAIAEFAASKAADPGFDAETWKQFTHKEELAKAAGYFLEYIDFMNAHELQIAISSFSFANPEIPGFRGEITIQVGLDDGRVIPIYFEQGETVWSEYTKERFVDSMLVIYDNKFGKPEPEGGE
jgi:hypothetical protein